MVTKKDVTDKLIEKMYEILNQDLEKVSGIKYLSTSTADAINTLANTYQTLITSEF